MAHDFETISTHEPALSRQHQQGPGQDRLSPAERSLAPEAQAPIHSAHAIADDQRYVGQGGGYKESDAPGGAAQVSSGNPSQPAAAARSGEADLSGAGTYGYPAGLGVGVPGGEHQPEGLPDPYAPGPEDLLPPEPTVLANQRLAAKNAKG